MVTALVALLLGGAALLATRSVNSTLEGISHEAARLCHDVAGGELDERGDAGKASREFRRIANNEIPDRNPR